jgi:urease beta subunit
VIPGEVLPVAGSFTLNEGRPRVRLRVENRGDRPIQVGSHFHFFEANPLLRFDRATAYGMRLDVPAGSAVRFEPGDVRDVALIPIGGRRRVFGLNGLVDGELDDPAVRRVALERAKRQQFGGAE